MKLYYSSACQSLWQILCMRLVWKGEKIYQNKQNNLPIHIHLDLFRCINQISTKPSERIVLAIVLLSNFGLLVIDHIHFQYNGIMFGILLISIAYMLEEKFLQSALYFAILLNMKHIFVYISPIYIVYLLKVYCWHNRTFTAAAMNLIKLGTITIGVTLLSFGPFYKHIPQVNWIKYLFWKNKIKSIYFRCCLVFFHSNVAFATHIGHRIFGLYTTSLIKWHRSYWKFHQTPPHRIRVAWYRNSNINFFQRFIRQQHLLLRLPQWFRAF